jgi:very-short-patch-repair endonuclease
LKIVLLLLNLKKPMTIQQFLSKINLLYSTGNFGSLSGENEFARGLLREEFKIPYFTTTIVEQIAVGLGLAFTNEKEAVGNVCFANSDELRPEFMQSFASIDLLDYIYAVLHSPTYREKHKEFLKNDFPGVPYPTDTQTFWKLVALGGELRQIHLLESPTIEKYITQYPEDGDNVVVKPNFIKNPVPNSPPKTTSTENSPLSPTSENSPLKPASVNSPPLEGCPQGGVVPSPEEFPTNAIPDIASKNQVIPDTTIKSTPIFFNPILELPYNIKLKTRARELRQAENLSEILFWKQLTKNQFYKIDFDRQRIIGNYIVDFYVKKLGLVVEIDGSSHDNKEEYDKVREEYLLSLGLKVYRIPVVEVLQNIKGVMRKLEEFIIKNYGEPNGKALEDMESPRPAGTPPMEGNLEPFSKDKNLGRVYINPTQYFDNVPELAWNFYIGGYQPAQKWLKDRKDRELGYEDILHYQKIIVALSETDRIMKEIDTIEIE